MSDDQRTRLVELSSSVESDFASHRPEVDGRPATENEIEAILKESDDEALRRRAWEASKEIGSLVADRIRELARVRNETARALGFADYYRMSLDLQEIDEAWLFGLLAELEELTEKPFFSWKASLDARLKERFRTDLVLPWHLSDPFFQQLPADGGVSLDQALREGDALDLTRRTFARWGIDLSGVFAKSDLFPRANKCQHAFCLDVDRSGEDVRILANVVPGERWIEVMLHESGHAAYDCGINRGLPYLLHRPAHTFVTEGIAILCGRLVHDPGWLASIAGVDERGLDGLGEAVRRASAARALLFARWGLVMVNFERDLYADPEGDLDHRWWELVHRFQGVEGPAGRTAPDWATKIHVAVAPVYYHNYLLGEMFASQLRAALEAAGEGTMDGPEVGRFLEERVFRHGALLRGDLLVESATGRRLAATDLASDLESAI
jgi:peptidyl-dipeptidase A